MAESYQRVSSLYIDTYTVVSQGLVRYSMLAAETPLYMAESCRQVIE